MSPNQKRAWGNIIVWGAFLIASAIVLAANGTVFFWQEDSLKNVFHALIGTALAAFGYVELIALDAA